jgi:hypothetical protein
MRLNRPSLSYFLVGFGEAAICHGIAMPQFGAILQPLVCPIVE